MVEQSVCTPEWLTGELFENHNTATLIWFARQLVGNDSLAIRGCKISNALKADWKLRHVTRKFNNTIIKSSNKGTSRGSSTMNQAVVKIYVFNSEEVCNHFLQTNTAKKIFFIYCNHNDKHSLQEPQLMIPQLLDQPWISMYTLEEKIPHVWSARGADNGVPIVSQDESELLLRVACDIRSYFLDFGHQVTACDVLSSDRRWSQSELCTHKLSPQPTEIDEITGSNDSTGHVFGRNANDDDALSIQSEDCLELEQEWDATVIKPDYPEIHRTAEASLPLPSSTVNVDAITTDIPCEDPTYSMELTTVVERWSLQETALPNEQKNNLNICVYFHLPDRSAADAQVAYHLLDQLLGSYLMMTQDKRVPLARLERADLRIFILALSSTDDELRLDDLCSLNCAPAIYILLLKPNVSVQQQELIKKYNRVYAVFDDPKELAVQVTLDIAFQCRVQGGRYARSGDKDHSIAVCDQSIRLLHKLKTIVQEISEFGEPTP